MIITENKLGFPLKTIDSIIITPYISNIREPINIFDITFTFDENILPLLTSLFEFPPSLIKSKIYNCIDSVQIFNKKLNVYPEKQNCYSNTQSNIIKNNYASFYNDINDLNLLYYDSHENYYDYKTVKTIIDNDTNIFARIYTYDSYSAKVNNMTTNYNFLTDVINEEENYKFIWEWEKFNTKFEIVLYDRINGIKKCKFQFIIKIIEDNKFIKSKLEHINHIINIISKIKSTINLS